MSVEIPHPGITILGLGPGSLELLTLQVNQALESCTELWVHTPQHPVLEHAAAHLQIRTFEAVLDATADYATVHALIVEKIIELAQRPQGVVYAVPGHPGVGDATVADISKRAQQLGVPVRILAGVSFVEPVLQAVGVNAHPGIVLIQAQALVGRHVPPFPPNIPVLISQVADARLASDVLRIMRSLYPAEHPAVYVHHPGSSQELVERMTLRQIDQSAFLGSLSVLYLPALGTATAFESLLEVVAHLRAPDGCPWDREQDYRSLRSSMLEETYELLSALDAGDRSAMREELGDLLMLILMYAQIACENGDFNIAEVLASIHTKLIQRHPHVFGSEIVEDVNSVLQNWEKIKAAERQSKGKIQASMLDGVPLALPALAQAEQYVKRAARVGFDWPEIAFARAKVGEELSEVDLASTPEEVKVEMGDLLFAVVNLARWQNVDPESALREANARFRNRFSRVEALARQQERSMVEMSITELIELWRMAKQQADCLPNEMNHEERR